MTDYRDFMQQAELDLSIAEKLLHDEIYWLSAFCIQQGVEKYLKAFLLKYQVFNNPERLGHLQYHEIFNEMTNMFRISLADKWYDEESKNQILDTLEALRKFILDLTDSPQKKIMIWKSSLGIAVRDHENKIMEEIMSGITKRTENTMPVLVDALQKLKLDFTEIDSDKLDDKAKFVIERFVAITTSVEQYVKNKTLDFKTMQNNLVEILGKASYGTGSNLLSKNDSDHFMRITALNQCIDWSDVVIDTYPHEQISRYPIVIDGNDSIELYKQNKDGLIKLFNRTRIACNDIRSKILLFPHNS